MTVISAPPLTPITSPTLLLKHVNRFNVAFARPRHKLVVVGSIIFFAQVPHDGTALHVNDGFIAYYHRCREPGLRFVWPPTDSLLDPLPLECPEPDP